MLGDDTVDVGKPTRLRNTTDEARFATAWQSRFSNGYKLLKKLYEVRLEFSFHNVRLFNPFLGLESFGIQYVASYD